MWREARGEWAGRRIRFFTQQQLAAAGFLGRGCLDLRPSSAMTTRPRTRTFSATLAVYICDFFIMFGIEAISVGKIVGQNGQAAAQEILLCWLAADAGLAPPPAPAPRQHGEVGATAVVSEHRSSSRPKPAEGAVWATT